MHGSPVASISVTQGGSGLSSRAVPLDFNQSIGGIAPNQAALYSTVLLGKDITLNYNGMGPVAKWTTSLTLPAPVNNAWLEMPTGYMQPDLDTYWTYDAGSDALNQAYPAACDPQHAAAFPPPSGYGGVIISNADGSLAQGVYAATTSVGGPAAYFLLFDFVHNCPTLTSKWDVVTPTRSFPAGQSTYTSYVVTGALSAVRGLMHTLYTSGAR